MKSPSDPYYPLVKAFQDVVCHNPPSVLPPDRGVRHEIDLVPGTKYSHDSGLCQTNSVISLMTSVVQSTRRVWCVRASLHTLRLPFVSRNPTVSGALFMLIISSMRPLSRHRRRYVERMFVKTIWWVPPCTAHST